MATLTVLDVMEFVRYCNALEADPCEGILQLVCPAEETVLLAAESSPKYNTRNKR